MPQMSPIYWLLLLMMSTINLYMWNSSIFFMTSLIKKSKTKYKLYWKW